MYTYFKVIDRHILESIYEYEDQQLLRVKSELDSLCISICKRYGWNYNFYIYRWTDHTDKRVDRFLDGYTATLQIDFTDTNGNVVEVDESVCSFFENVTFITFDPIRRKYRVFQNEELVKVCVDIKQLICSLEDFI